MLKIKPKNNNSMHKKAQHKRKNSNASKTVQELLSIKSINENVINTEIEGKYYIRVSPKNINILTEDLLLGEIERLRVICNITENIEFLVLDKAERLEDNKSFVSSLISETEEPIYKELLKKDLENLKNLETVNGASREFYIIIPFKDYEKSKPIFEKIEQAIENKGFSKLICNKNTIKNMLQVYLERNFSGEAVKDIDI